MRWLACGKIELSEITSLTPRKLLDCSDLLAYRCICQVTCHSALTKALSQVVSRVMMQELINELKTTVSVAWKLHAMARSPHHAKDSTGNPVQLIGHRNGSKEV